MAGRASTCQDRTIRPVPSTSGPAPTPRRHLDCSGRDRRRRRDGSRCQRAGGTRRGRRRAEPLRLMALHRPPPPLLPPSPPSWTAPPPTGPTGATMRPLVVSSLGPSSARRDPPGWSSPVCQATSRRWPWSGPSADLASDGNVEIDEFEHGRLVPTVIVADLAALARRLVASAPATIALDGTDATRRRASAARSATITVGTSRPCSNSSICEASIRRQVAGAGPSPAGEPGTAPVNQPGGARWALLGPRLGTTSGAVAGPGGPVGAGGAVRGPAMERSAAGPVDGPWTGAPSASVDGSSRLVGIDYHLVDNVDHPPEQSRLVSIGTGRLVEGTGRIIRS